MKAGVRWWASSWCLRTGRVKSQLNMDCINPLLPDLIFWGVELYIRTYVIQLVSISRVSHAIPFNSWRPGSINIMVLAPILSICSCILTLVTMHDAGEAFPHGRCCKDAPAVEYREYEKVDDARSISFSQSLSFYLKKVVINTTKWNLISNKICVLLNNE